MKPETLKAIDRDMNLFYRDIAMVAQRNVVRSRIAGDLKAHKLLGIKPAFDLIQKEALEYSREYGKLLTEEGASIIKGKKVPWLKDHVKDTRSNVLETIREGIKTGKPVSDIAGKKAVKGTIAYDLKQVMKEEGRSMATIARTEVARVQSAGAMNRYKKAGVKKIKYLCGGSPCPICIPDCNKIFDIVGAPEIPRHPNSYSKDTEAYTEKGFKNISDIKVGDRVLSLNPTTFDLEYIKVANLVSHHQDKMLEFVSHNFNLCVTPNHDLFCLRRERKHTKKREWEFIPARDVPSETRFYRSSKWQGEMKEYVTINGKHIDTNIFCAFMGFWLSEGYIVSTPETHGWRIGLSQDIHIHEDTYWRMYETIEGLGVNVNHNDKEITFHNKVLYDYLKQFGKAYKKYVPIEIKELSAEQIRIFLDAYILGDGHRRKGRPFKNGNFRDEITYTTSSKRMADDLGELLIKVGKRPSYYLLKIKGKTVSFKNGDYVINHNIWIIRECYAQTSQIAESGIRIKEIEYNDLVFCVELEKHHTLYVRRNGKCTWCGNCTCDIAPVIEK